MGFEPHTVVDRGGAAGTAGAAEGGQGGQGGRAGAGGTGGTQHSGSGGRAGEVGLEAGAAGASGAAPGSAGMSGSGGGVGLGGAAGAGESSGGAAGHGGDSGGSAGAGGDGGAGPIVPPAPVVYSDSCRAATRDTCASLWVPGGTYLQGGGLGSMYVRETTVSGFYLDMYEVTVGRFRAFVENYDEWHGTLRRPARNEGEHPLVPESGWNSSRSFTWSLPEDEQALRRVVSRQDLPAWTDVTGTATTERAPMNVVDWYIAFAFCVWDGGRLPTEAEWEYAARGGDENWAHAWGDEPATQDLAVCCGVSAPPYPPVGSRSTSSQPMGVGRWGHHDLNGSMYEWVLDVYEPYGATPGETCVNCAVVTSETSVFRVGRGGGWIVGPEYTESRGRGSWQPTQQNIQIGFRCARDHGAE